MMLCINYTANASVFNWTGANGTDWSDTLNWLDGGGNVPSNAPTAFDDVYIVEGTYFIGATTVNINGSAQCKNMTITVPASSAFTGTFTTDLSIYGSYTGDADFSYAGFAGNLYFKTPYVGQTITMNGSSFNKSVIFDSPNGEWILQDHFYSPNTVMNLTRGTLDFGGSNYVVTLKRFTSDNLNNRSLDISYTVIHLNDGYDVNGIKVWDLERTTGLVWPLNLMGSEIHMNGDIAQGNRATSFASEGLDYNKVFFHNVFTTANLYGDNVEFDELSFDGSAHLKGDNNIAGNVTMTGGKTYTITESHTFDITNSLTAQGSCLEYTTLTSTLSGAGKEATINFTGNVANLSLSYLIIESVDLTGATYTGSTIYNMTNSTGWPTLGAVGQNFYWVGGAGDWSDATHWSIGSSGGSGNGFCIPGPLDNVIFDGASGLGTGLACNVDVTNAYCHSMNWTAATSGAGFTSNSTLSYQRNKLNVYGSIHLSSTMDYQYDGNISCRYNNAITPYLNTIDAATQSLLAPITIEGQNGAWVLASDLNSSSTFYQKAGVFRTMNFDMYLYRFNSKVRNARTIDLGSSLVELTGFWSVHLRTSPVTVDLTLNLIEGTSTIRMLNYGFNQIWDLGEDYYNVELMNANANSIIYGSNTFNNLSFYGNGSLHSQNTINGTLLFSPGKSYSLSNLQTFGPSGTLDANGNCNSYIGINNGSFYKASGNITANYAVIQDNDGTGGATYNTNNSILSGTTGWLNGIVNTAPYYFKATTSENWGDPNNWYGVYSGGNFSAPTFCIPGPGNDVHFFGSSFTPNYPNLVIDELNAYCHSMIWDAIGSYPTVPEVTSTTTNNRLNVYGSMTLRPITSMDWEFDGWVDFKTADATPHSITSEGQVFLRDVTFKGAVHAVWNLTDDFETALTQINAYTSPTLRVSQGTFNSNTHKITAGAFHSVGGNTRTVDLIDSEIFLTTKTVGGTVVAWRTSSSASGQPLTLKLKDSELHLNNIHNYNGAQIIATEADFHDVYFDNTGLGIITGGDNSFQLADFNGHGAIYRNNDFHVLRFEEGKTYDLEAGYTQRLVADVNSNPGVFDATGNVGTSLINIVSSIPGVQAYLEHVDGTICIDYSNITDISVSQPAAGTLAFAGAHSNNISNNSGWSFDDCVIPVMSGCVGTPIDFTTLINGTSFDWTFGDGQTGVGAPISHTYTAAGTYNVFVVIGTFNQGSISEDGRNFLVEVSENCCKAGDDVNYTDKSGIISGYENWPDKVFVSADVFVTGDAELDITNSDVVFASGTGIYFQSRSHLSATNSTFRPCASDDYWLGLHFDSLSSGKVTESILINARSGITASTDGTVESSNNQYLNNQTAISVEVEAEMAVDHVITGNTITINRDNPFSELGNPVDFNGVLVNMAFFESTIAQNQFVYTSSLSNIDRVYGIHNNGGALTASDNVFTNVSFGYTQIASNGPCGFENNVVNFNRDASNLYTSVADLVAVTIHGGALPTLIASNEMNLSYDISANSKGIYVDAASTVIIHENEIEGFKEGVHANDMQGLISNNEIKHSDIGILSLGMEYSGILDNKVDFSDEFGIYVENSFDGIRVNRNTVKNNPDVSGSVGIKYFMNQAVQPADVEFIENCVFDTEIALEFTNTSSEMCIELPFIRGNYLFSYSKYGLYVHRLFGFVGTSGNDPGRNTFLSNNGALASDVYYYVTGPICDQLFMVDNWPMALSIAGPSYFMVDVQIPTGGRHSQSTCGNQDIAELGMSRYKYLPVMQDYLGENLPIDLIADDYFLKADFGDQLKAIQEEDRLELMELLLAVFVQNDQALEVEQLLLKGDDVLNESEAKWLRMLAAEQFGNFDEALSILSATSTLPYKNDDFLSIKNMRLQYTLSNRDWNGLELNDQILLLNMENKKETSMALARDLIHIAEGGRPYLYRASEVHASSLGNSGFRKEFTNGELLIFPNPAQEKVQLKYSLSGERLSFTVYDMYGKLIEQQRLSEGITKAELNVSDWSAGVYLIHIEEDGSPISTHRLVVE